MKSYIYKVYLVLSTYFIFMRNNNYSQVWVIERVQAGKAASLLAEQLKWVWLILHLIARWIS